MIHVAAWPQIRPTNSILDFQYNLKKVPTKGC